MAYPLGDSDRWAVVEGDCVEHMANHLDAESVDSIVTDPPYHLTSIVKRFGSETAAPAKEGTDGRFVRSSRGFMGKTWDGGDVAFRVETWSAAYRVLKPGGYLIAFGGTRTYHRLACAIEDAGFEIRDCAVWAYGTGFPKSLDVSKAIDRAAGAERSPGVPGPYSARRPQLETKAVSTYRISDGVGDYGSSLLTAPATDAARQWAGWGTALKPAWEPIVIARKPFRGTVADNVLAYGTGALNIDGCRLSERESRALTRNASIGFGGSGAQGVIMDGGAGRWPANLYLDRYAAESIDAQSGTVATDGEDAGASRFYFVAEPDDADLFDASRPPWFYIAKPDRAERDTGMDGVEPATDGEATNRVDGSAGVNNPRAGAGRTGGARNTHPTVKPVSLLVQLVTLVTPPGGVVLDPFVGSGTTVMAALRGGFRGIGVEMTPEYAAIARRRIVGDSPLFNRPAGEA